MGSMSKGNAKKFYALYQQHKALADRLAKLDAQSEEALLAGLAKIAKEMGLECSKDELSGVVKDSRGDMEAHMEGVAGGWSEEGSGWPCPQKPSNACY